jgi:hypothetical protein
MHNKFIKVDVCAYVGLCDHMHLYTQLGLKKFVLCKKRTFGLQSSMKNIQYNTLPKLHAPGSQAAALHASTNRKRRMIKERRRHALVIPWLSCVA